MSILLDEETRVIVQGITGRIGAFHTEEMIAYGTNIVGGVTPGKGGQKILGKRIYDTVKEAVRFQYAEASIVFVPPPFAADAIMEAADAGIRYCVCITDGVPAQDMMRVKRYMRRYRIGTRMRLTGPNCAGTISPGKALLGIMPGHIYLPGRVGVISRSGTLSYEAASQLKELGIGISTSVGIGGDPVNGSSFRDHLGLFEHDDETDAVLMIGEIGGPQEAEGAAFVRDRMTKPVIGYVAGLTAPPGRTMGHAGAIVSSAGESATEKAQILAAAGITMAPDPSSLGTTVAQVLREHDLLARVAV
jgi:malate-CoA ligase subunit alpha